MRSADGHLVEPPDALAERVDLGWRDIAPRLVRLADGGDAYVIDGIGLTLPIHEILGCPNGAGWEAVPDAAWDPASRLEYQKTAGLSGELLFPTIGLLLSQHPDPRYRSRFAAAYNRWLEDCWLGRPELAALAMAEQIDSPEARRTIVREADRAGFAGLVLPAEPPDGAWGDSKYRSLFAEMAEAGLLACFHAFMRPIHRGTSRRAAAVFAASHQAMDLFSEVALSGLVAETKGLKILFGEGETWWLPTWLKRMAEASADLVALEHCLRVTTDEVPRHATGFALFASDFPHGAGNDLPPNSSGPSTFTDGSFWFHADGGASGR
jgi:hypothetical protein